MDVRGLQTPQPALWVQTSAFLTVPELEQRPQLNFHLMALALPLHPVWLLKMSQVQGWGWRSCVEGSLNAQLPGGTAWPSDRQERAGSRGLRLGVCVQGTKGSAISPGGQ